MKLNRSIDKRVINSRNLCDLKQLDLMQSHESNKISHLSSLQQVLAPKLATNKAIKLEDKRPSPMRQTQSSVNSIDNCDNIDL